jgi:hypothetical protein
MMEDAYLIMGSFKLYTDEGSGFVLRDTKEPNTGNFGTYIAPQYARVTFFNYQTALEDTPIKVTYEANIDSARFAPGEGPAPAGPPSSDWDTYEEGAGTVPALSTSDQTVTYDSSYPNQNASWALRVTNVGGNWPFQYAPGTNFMSAADKATMSPYVAIYCQADEFNGRGNAAGWYVFGPGVDNTPENGTIDYPAPVAWPTGANDGTGKLDSNVSGVVNCVVWLSDYTGSTGDGGTDSWTEPTDLLTP